MRMQLRRLGIFASLLMMIWVATGCHEDDYEYGTGDVLSIIFAIGDVVLAILDSVGSNF